MSLRKKGKRNMRLVEFKNDQPIVKVSVTKVDMETKLKWLHQSLLDDGSMGLRIPRLFPFER